ncbi:MAG: hypothetical protein GY943_07690 [Chloroflexi bacterium]|nr:hypothetical protein [Chloroflexota bacterium]
MTRNLRSNSFNSLWRIQLVSLIVMLLLSVGNFQTQEQTAYAQGSICTDRPANERSTPPATIWVEVETHYSEWGETGPVEKEVTFDFYISGVLLGELGDSPDDITNANLPSNNGLWEDAVLEAMAVAIRSFTWFRLNYAGQFPDPYDPHAITRDNTNQCGFWDEKIDSGQQINAQTFRPFQAGVSQAIKDHYFDIVTQHVPNIYLVEANGTHPIDAQYRATVGENSDPGGKSYLVSIFDPISAGDTDPTNASGMGQWGAQRWAMGLNDNNVRFPRWESYEQVLFHYYANAHLKVVNGAILTPAYRWNPLTVNWSGGAVDPPTMYSGNTYNVTLHLQNSGEAEWGSDVKLVYYWLRNGSRVTNSTLVDVDNLDEGDDDNNKNLSVHVPGSFQNGEAVTLMIDLRRTGDSSGRYFSNRESSRPWFNLRYNLCLGGDCLSYLPIILKGHTPPAPCSHNQQLIVNNGFENGYPPTPWVEVSPYQIVYNGVSAHSGSWHAYMAGYPNANDKLYQNFGLGHCLGHSEAGLG